MQLEKVGRTILVADDEPEMREFLQLALRSDGYNVETAFDGDDLLEHLQANDRVSAVLLDIVMPRKNGLDALREIRSRHKDLPVIILSGVSSTTNIVEAMKSGATDFIGKPFDQHDLLAIIDHALERSGERSKPVAAKTNDAVQNPKVRALYEAAAWVGPAETPVLIQGETGSGKEVLAKHLHALSPRAQKAFVKLNCAALPSELVESELFGYERGAFTGAFQRKPGMFEMADGGTLLLDEIGDMDFRLQAKLLQVLQDHEFQRLGGKGTIRVDVRVIAATHQNLEKLIGEGKFRQDLFYRLNVVTLEVPALRNRKEDLLPLTKTLLRKHAIADTPLPEITPELAQAMTVYDWPGNIRELENVVRKLLVLRDPAAVAADLNARTARKTLSEVPELHANGASEDVEISQPILAQVGRARAQAETEVILAALNSTHWNRKDAAALLKIDYKALLYKMKKLGIEDKMASLPGKTRRNGNSHIEEPLKVKTVAASSPDD
jgi:two-component system response regulator AtoC